VKITARLAAVCGALALALALSACGSQTEPGAASSTDPAAAAPMTSQTAAAAHNDADVEFAQMMSVHHEGAIAMADLAAKSGNTEGVRTLAARISAAQGPEIDKMRAWLKAWGAPNGAATSMEGMDMSGGAQSSAMDELRGLTGADFDRRFLELMTEHHRSAVTMAETELSAGKDPEALALAQTIQDTQKAEITEMGQLIHAL